MLSHFEPGKSNLLNLFRRWSLIMVLLIAWAKKKCQVINQLLCCWKPKKEAPSNLSIVGRYVIWSIWPLLAKTAPGAGDEIQLTDAIAMLIEKEPVEPSPAMGKATIVARNNHRYMEFRAQWFWRQDFTQWLNH